MKKTLFASLLFLAVGFTASFGAERDSVVTRNVTVEREYVPVVNNAGKIPATPQIPEAREIKIDVRYADFHLPLPLGANIHKLPSARLSQPVELLRDGFAQIGLGFYPNTLVEFAYPLVKRPDMQLDFTLRHRGNFGTELYSKSAAALHFDKQFERLAFCAGLNAAHDMAGYYGKRFAPLTGLDTLPGTGVQAFLRAAMYVGIRSVEEPYGWHYNTRLRYRVTGVPGSLSEHNVALSGGLSWMYDDDRIGVDADLQNFVYDQALSTAWENYALAQVNPYYDLSRSESWKLRLGLKAAFAFGQGRVISPSPDIRFDWKPAPAWLGIYGGLTGEYRINALADIPALNPYLMLDSRLQHTYTPFLFFAGVDVKPFAGFLIDLYANYRFENNALFFVNRPVLKASSVLDYWDNRFDAFYAKATHFKSGLRMSYNHQNRMDFQLKAAYNDWDIHTPGERAWGMPVWEADFSAGFNATKELAFSLNILYEGERYARLADPNTAGKLLAVPMGSKLDVNLGASYNYVDWLSFFAKLNNVFNNRYQIFHGYRAPGVNLMFGASFAF